MEDLIVRVSIKSAVTVALGTSQSQDASPARPEPLAGPRTPSIHTKIEQSLN